MDFAGKRYWFFAVSLIILLPGVAFLIIAGGLNPGIDFTGGSSLSLKFVEPVKQEELRAQLSTTNIPVATVQNLGENSFFIRTKELSTEEKDALVGNLKSALSPGGVEVLSFDLVSPVTAKKTVIYSFWAVLAAAVGMFLYIWWAFRSVPKPLRYSLAAIIALVHDTLVVIGIFAILGKVMDLEVDTTFLAALLTVIGYSVNDTIVIFDRLRENIHLYPNRRLAEVANLSISETFARSVNTSLTTVLVLLALFLFGGSTLRPFVLALTIGIVAGTYSSIGIASALLVSWEEGDLVRLYRRVRSVRFGARSTKAA